MTIRASYLIALSLSLAALLHAPMSRAGGSVAAVQPKEQIDVFVEAINELHDRRRKLMSSQTLPGNRPLPGRMEDILPLADGTALERSTDFITRMGSHGLAIDVDLSHRIEALMQEWLVAPQTLASAEHTARAQRSVDELEVVFADAVANQRAFRAHLARNLRAVWEHDPGRDGFMAGFSKGRAKVQPIIDELAANRGRLAAAIRAILDFADSRRDVLRWDEASSQLLLDTDEDVAAYNRLVAALQKSAAQEETIVANLMAAMSESVESIQKKH